MAGKEKKEDLCEICKKKIAEIGVIGLENNKVVDHLYCEDCYNFLYKRKGKKRDRSDVK